jgi:AcrR family transcriptional regulator
MPKGVPVTDETKGEILAMYGGGQGMSIADIAQEVGLSVPTIYAVLNASDALVAKTTEVDNELLVVAFNRYQHTDDSVADICMAAGLDVPRFYALLRESKIALRTDAQSASRAERLEAAVRMYIENEPLWRITDATNIAQPTLNAELHKRGVPLRRPRA